MNYLDRSKRLLLICIAVVVAIICFFASSVAYAELAPATKFEQTDAYDDLKSSNGFNIRDYPFSSTKTPGIIQFVEYCYSPFQARQENFGLYVYFYNPHNTKFDDRSKQNKITIATEFDEKLSPINYQDFNLEFCTKSEDDNQYNKFLKFKVSDTKAFLKEVNSEERKYAVSGIYLLEEGQQNADSYQVGGVYVFSGYAKGYGPNADTSTLVCNVEDLTTIIIGEDDIGQTSYNFKANNEKGTGWHNQINAVYFSVPNDILNDYGRLQIVKFNTYRYKTAPILVTKDDEEFDLFYNNRGKRHGFEWNCEDTYIANFEARGPATQPSLYRHGDIAFGKSVNDILPFKDNILRVNQLPYVFKRDFPTDSDDQFIQVLSSNELLDYIYKYNASNHKGYLPHRNLTKDLFITGNEDPFIDKEIDAGSQHTLTNVSVESGWDKFWRELFGKKPDTTMLNLDPIVKIEDGYNPDGLYINPNDVNEFNNKINIAKGKDRSMHLFRFAIDDYFSSYVKKAGLLVKKTDMFMAQTTAYLDFKIIELTFFKDGVYKMFPVVMNPIDVVSGINSPSETLPSWKMPSWLVGILTVMLIIFIVIIVIKVVIPLLSFIFKGFGKKNKTKQSITNNTYISNADVYDDYIKKNGNKTDKDSKQKAKSKSNNKGNKGKGV